MRREELKDDLWELKMLKIERGREGDVRRPENEGKEMSS